MAAPALELAPAPDGAAAARAGRDPAARAADHRGHVPVRAGRRQLVVRPARARPGPSSTGGCCRSSPRTGARRCTSCPRTRARPGRSRSGRSALPRGRRAKRPSLPGVLVRGLLGWDGDTDAVVAEWLWCRRIPRACAACSAPPPAGRRSWTGSRRCSTSASREPGTPPRLDLVEAAQLYQTLYWIARTAAVPTPAADVLHVTAAGWSGIPALVHKALHGTPMVLTEHGVYLREAYLAAARGGGSPGARFTATRLARGLARAAYAGADVICPVTDANAYWEMSLGHRPGEDPRALQRAAASPSRRRRRRGGAWSCPSAGSTRSRTSTRCCGWRARRCGSSPTPVPALRRGRPRARRPTSARAWRCTSGSGSASGFRFMGRTTDPNGAVRGADVVLMTSISEGLPMSVLEAMSQGRPIVSTCVGGVPDVVKGCGALTVARRRPRARDGGRDAAAQSRPRVAARAARPRPARADLQRAGLRRGLPLAAARAVASERSR